MKYHRLKACLGSFFICGCVGLVQAQCDSLVDPDAERNDRFGVDVSVSGSIMAVGAPGDDVRGADSGIVFIFEKDSNGNWNKTATIKAGDEGDNFGTSVSLDGKALLIGAPDADNGGRVYLYEKKDGKWKQIIKLKANDRINGDRFGASVGLAGGKAIIGAPEADSGNKIDAGEAYIFKKSNGQWKQQARIRAGDRGTNDRFGTSVGIFEKDVIVGAPFHDETDPDVGAIYFFHFGNNSWTQKTQKNGPSDDAEFGTSVSMGDGWAVAGQRKIWKGRVYKKKTDGSNKWEKKTELVPNNSAVYVDEADFDVDVHINGDRIVMGVSTDDNDVPGSAFIYKRFDGVWVHVAERRSLASATEKFGGAVSQAGTESIIGAAGSDDDRGIVYAYDPEVGPVDEFLVRVGTHAGGDLKSLKKPEDGKTFKIDSGTTQGGSKLSILLLDFKPAQTAPRQLQFALRIKSTVADVRTKIYLFNHDTQRWNLQTTFSESSGFETHPIQIFDPVDYIDPELNLVTMRIRSFRPGGDAFRAVYDFVEMTSCK
ncbi:MAG: FG-GAP repeat protein [Planctomycetota bacterium]|nr:FG-GAP repeat protein [Planctomycetota bacterium]